MSILAPRETNSRRSLLLVKDRHDDRMELRYPSFALLMSAIYQYCQNPFLETLWLEWIILSRDFITGRVVCNRSCEPEMHLFREKPIVANFATDGQNSL